MRNYTFLFKENETDDRDCVRYVDLEDLKKNHTCIDGKLMCMVLAIQCH